MSSQAKILFSEGNPLLSIWDNDMVINVKLHDNELRDLIDVAKGKKRDIGKLMFKKYIEFKILKENTEIRSIIHITDMKELMEG